MPVEFKSICFLLNCLSVTHPAVWRSDGCSLQPADSCNLQETHIKPHQTCARSPVRRDCISLSKLPRKLNTCKRHNMQLSVRVQKEEILYETFHILLVYKRVLLLSANNKNKWITFRYSHVRCSRTQISRKYRFIHTWNTCRYALHYHEHHIYQNHVLL